MGRTGRRWRKANLSKIGRTGGLFRAVKIFSTGNKSTASLIRHPRRCAFSGADSDRKAWRIAPGADQCKEAAMKRWVFSATALATARAVAPNAHARSGSEEFPLAADFRGVRGVLTPIRLRHRPSRRHRGLAGVRRGCRVGHRLRGDCRRGRGLGRRSQRRVARSRPAPCVAVGIAGPAPLVMRRSAK